MFYGLSSRLWGNSLLPCCESYYPGSRSSRCVVRRSYQCVMSAEFSALAWITLQTSAFSWLQYSSPATIQLLATVQLSGHATALWAQETCTCPYSFVGAISSSHSNASINDLLSTDANLRVLKWL